MANTYDVGDEVKLKGEFTDDDGNAQDPTTVTFAFLAPSASSATEYVYGTDAEVVKESTGVYYVNLGVTEAGTWRWRFYSTGTGKSAGESYFYAREQKVI
jgi:hypothetical protein